MAAWFTTRMSAVVARSGTCTCSLVPPAQIESGVTATLPRLPALSRVWKTTRVHAPKFVPVSSITAPTLAEAFAASAGLPSAATAVIPDSVAVGTVTSSRPRSRR